ncbi:MAG: efflux RND transporter permease subunit [Myxococcota bacterium]
MNLARVFAEKPQIGWVALVAVLVWGGVSYVKMPQRKDPEIKIKTAVITTVWPGASAEDVEQLVTRPLELLAGQVARVDVITSTSRAGRSTVFVTLEDSVRPSQVEPVWEDLRGRLDTLKGLPATAQRPVLNSNFGDTATVVYSLASPPADPLEVSLRAELVRRVVEPRRARSPGERQTTIIVFPDGVDPARVHAAAAEYVGRGRAAQALDDATVLGGARFVAIDFSPRSEAGLAELDERFLKDVVGPEQPHPDVWGPVRVGPLDTLEATLRAAAPDKYSYRELDDAARLVRDEVTRLPGVGRAELYGVVPERVSLFFSQERLAALNVNPRQVAQALRARNAALPGGTLNTGQQLLLVDPRATFDDANEILDTVVANTPDGKAVSARDVLEVRRTYDPSSDTSWLVWRGPKGDWRRTRSVALAVQARSGVQVTKLGEELTATIASLRGRVPDDLEIVRTADQPELVHDKISEFMRSLVEAVVIVIAVALLFMERRSALLVAASIPLTLAMTFGIMRLLGIDLQQVSIASLIIALGLLVDDPVVASDAINREIAAGVPRVQAAWQGPTKLAKAIFFATLTNIVAFAPLLLIEGSMGEFIYSLPVVVTASLVSSRIVSMTFMPLLGRYLLRGQKGFEAALEGGGRTAELARKYNAITSWMLDHKLVTSVGFFAFLVLGLAPVVKVKTHFFPEEPMNRFYVHVRLPEGSDVRATARLADQARALMLEQEGDDLERLTMFIGDGGPRWWSNVAPEPRNPAYALLIVHTRDEFKTREVLRRTQELLTRSIPGARFEAFYLSSGAPATIPVEVRISGPDVATLRRLGEDVRGVLRRLPATADVTDDWGAEAPGLRVEVDDVRANRAGVTREDVATASALALSGQAVTQLREGDRLIDVHLRLRASERTTASSLRALSVWSSRTNRPVPLEQVGSVELEHRPQKLVRYRQARTLTVGALPRPGELPSVLFNDARRELSKLELPPGYSLSYGGEFEQQSRAFGHVRIALVVSVFLILLVLVWQFESVFKPLIVFGAIPFGLVGAVLGLVATNTRFGFMAFLGVASLIGVIVSHIIVLFDFIEEAREHGVPLHRAVIDAGLVRLRPVLVTVLATVGGLIPLALEGGPKWQQLVYVQIGGLLLATLVTKGVVPVLYVVFVEQLKWVPWTRSGTADEPSALHTPEHSS